MYSFVTHIRFTQWLPFWRIS